MKKLVKNQKSVNNASLYAAEYYEVYCVSGVLDHKCQYEGGVPGSKDRVYGKIYTSKPGYCPKCGKNMYNCVMTSKYDYVNDIPCHKNHSGTEIVWRGKRYGQ